VRNPDSAIPGNTSQSKTGTNVADDMIPISLAQTKYSHVKVMNHWKYGICVAKEAINEPELLQREYKSLKALQMVKGVVRLLGRDGPEIGYGETLYLEYIQQSNWLPTSLKHFKFGAKELFSILAECHTIGVVHGDLSRNNVLVQEGTHSITLIDFNFSVRGIVWKNLSGVLVEHLGFMHLSLKKISKLHLQLIFGVLE